MVREKTHVLFGRRCLMATCRTLYMWKDLYTCTCRRHHIQKYMYLSPMCVFCVLAIHLVGSNSCPPHTRHHHSWTASSHLWACFGCPRAGAYYVVQTAAAHAINWAVAAPTSSIWAGAASTLRLGRTGTTSTSFWTDVTSTPSHGAAITSWGAARFASSSTICGTTHCPPTN